MTAHSAPTFPCPAAPVSAQPANAGPVARSVIEALHSVVSPAVARVVVEAALAQAGRTALPENPVAADTFVRGPLLETLASTLDFDGAQAFLARMEPILRLASLAPPPKSEARLRAQSGPVPLVVIASLDASHALEVGQCLGPVAQVETATNVLDLLLRLDGREPRQSVVVVVDGAMAPIDPVGLASMLPSDNRLTVILWRVRREQRVDIDASRPQHQSWLAFGEQATLRDLTDLLCERL